MPRATKRAGYTGGTGDLSAFADAESVSDWALDSVKWNIGSGLIVGSISVNVQTVMGIDNA